MRKTVYMIYISRKPNCSQIVLLTKRETRSRENWWSYKLIIFTKSEVNQFGFKEVHISCYKIHAHFMKTYVCFVNNKLHKILK